MYKLCLSMWTDLNVVHHFKLHFPNSFERECEISSKKKFKLKLIDEDTA